MELKDRDYLAVYEPNHGGHRLFYVQTLLKLAPDSNLEGWWLTSNRAASSDEAASFGLDVASCQAQVEVAKDSPTALRTKMQQLVATLLWRERTSRSRARHIIIPDGDVYLVALSLIAILLSMRRVSVLIMRPTGRAAIPRLVKYVCCRWLALRGAKVRRLVPSLIDANTSSDLGWLRPCLDPPTRLPLTSRSKARAHFGLSHERPLCLIAGVITERKSVGHVLSWLSSNPDWSLLLVGQQSDAVAKSVAKFLQDEECDRLAQLNSFVDDETLGWAYSAADVVLVLYENTGSSGVLLSAAMASRPVVAWGNETLVNMVSSLGIGVVASNRTPEGLDAALESVTENQEAILDSISSLTVQLDAAHVAFLETLIR